MAIEEAQEGGFATCDLGPFWGRPRDLDSLKKRPVTCVVLIFSWKKSDLVTWGLEKQWPCDLRGGGTPLGPHRTGPHRSPSSKPCFIGWIWVLSLSGGFTPCRHPSKEPNIIQGHLQGEQTVCLFSPVMMSTCWKKLGWNLPPGHGDTHPTLFDKWHRICDMPSRTCRHGWTSQRLYLPSLGAVGESQSAPAQSRFEPPTCRSIVEHAKHQTMPTDWRINKNYYTPGPQWGGGSSSYLGNRLREKPLHM